MNGKGDTNQKIKKLKPLDNTQLFPEFEPLGIHCAPLQVAGQTGYNHVAGIVSQVVVNPVQGPLTLRHDVLINELATLATVSAS